MHCAPERNRTSIRRGHFFFGAVFAASVGVTAALASEAEVRAETPIKIAGGLETDYQFNFERPANGITNFRGFDSRDDTFTLSNVWLDASKETATFQGRVTLQVGSAGTTYYASEPSRPGAAGASASNGEGWKYVQQAYAGHRFGAGRGVLVSAGIFLSPIGPEGIAVRDNWNWSRSNLFFGLPFYHTGVRAAIPVGERSTATLAMYNGWNSVVDNNDEKSVSAQLISPIGENLTVTTLYFGGVERSDGAAEGRAWRHLFDAHATWNVTPSLSFLAHADAGFESNDFGTNSWTAGAAAARVRVRPKLYLAGRFDAFFEEVASDATGSASAIFWPADWLSSGTVTLEAIPEDNMSIRVEVRHDRAESEIFFGDDAVGDGIEAPFEPNRDAQTTLTVGTTAWF